MTAMRGQRGATLLVALIMLVLLTLFAVSALNTSSTNLKVVGNMQMQGEALTATNSAVETVISTPDPTRGDFPLFSTTPAAAVASPCDGAANYICTDVSGNTVASAANAAYTVHITPECKLVRPITTLELSLSSSSATERALAQKCAAGQGQMTGVAGAVTLDSLCAYWQWDITADATPVSLGAVTSSTQGIGISISTDDMSTYAASCL